MKKSFLFSGLPDELLFLPGAVSNPSEIEPDLQIPKVLGAEIEEDVRQAGIGVRNPLFAEGPSTRDEALPWFPNNT